MELVTSRRGSLCSKREAGDQRGQGHVCPRSHTNSVSKRVRASQLTQQGPSAPMSVQHWSVCPPTQRLPTTLPYSITRSLSHHVALRKSISPRAPQCLHVYNGGGPGASQGTSVKTLSQHVYSTVQVKALGCVLPAVTATCHQTQDAIY